MSIFQLELVSPIVREANLNLETNEIELFFNKS